uniref:Zinc transporter 2 n=1 Tax=Centruroides hentzi TaxID=88313 RepID=A0A2I9LPZ2_9SCOR
MDNEKIPLTTDSSRLSRYETIHSKDNALIYCCHGNIADDCCYENGSAVPKRERQDSMVSESHCHPQREEDGADKLARRRLLFASGLCLVFMIAEVVGGLLANSLAIATDAAHLLTDFASFMISLMALWVAARPATKSMSFGWYRAEVIGALTSVLMIWVVTGVLVYLAIQRIINRDYEIQGLIMVITAAVGVLVNIVMGIVLQVGGVPHGHSHGDNGKNEKNHTHSNINVRAAFIHVLGDFFQSIGVLIASLIIYFKPEYVIVDPICTFLFSALVLATTFAIMKETLNVLMEGMPRGINFLDVQKILFGIPGVVKVHNLRIWSLSIDKTALSAHIAIAKGQSSIDILKQASREIHRNFNIFELTLQVEEYKEEMLACTRCQEPAD